MKTVSAGFQIAQAGKDIYPYAEVAIKRRYWNGSAYVWESAWTDLEETEFARVGEIIKQFDTDRFNEFKVGNVSVVLRNEDNRWLESTTTGQFKADGTAAFGYEPYLTKFRVRLGYRNVGGNDIGMNVPPYPGGSKEAVTVFTGLATNWRFDSGLAEMEVTVEGLERLLLDTDAEQVSTLVTLETIGTGNAILTDFVTANTRVGRITQVTVNAVVMNPGSDYVVSDLNSTEVGATVSLAAAPGVGQLVKATYLYWAADQTIEDLIEDLIAAAGITAFEIDAAIFNNAAAAQTKTSQADFQAGTNTAIDSVFTAGDFMADITASQNLLAYDVGGFTAYNPVPQPPDGYHPNFYNDGSVLQIRPGDVSDGLGVVLTGLKAPTTGRVKGTWKVDAKMATSGGSGNEGFMLWFIGNSDTQDDHGGYAINIRSGAFPTMQLIKTLNGSTTVLAFRNFGGGLTTSYQTYEVRRYHDAEIKVLVDGVEMLSATDTDVTTAASMYIQGPSAQLLTANSKIVYIKNAMFIPAATMTATHISATIDLTAGVAQLGLLAVDTTGALDLGPLNPDQSMGRIDWSTRTSPDGSTWDAWIANSAGTNGSAAMASNPQRYLQVRAEITDYNVPQGGLRPNNGMGILITHSYTVNYTSAQIPIAMANYTGKSVYDAVRALAEFADYEWGFDDEETFFFRSRVSGSSPQIALDEGRNVSRVSNLRLAYDQMYAKVRATYGSFIAEVEGNDTDRDSPLNILGVMKTLDVSDNGILIDKDTNLAAGVAQNIWDRLSAKRRRMTVDAILLPQVELSDVVQLTFEHDHFGDDPAFVDGMTCKVISVQHNLEDVLSRFELEEVV